MVIVFLNDTRVVQIKDLRSDLEHSTSQHYSGSGGVICQSSSSCPTPFDSRYIGIFTTYQQVIVIKKNRFGNFRKIIVIENVHLISSNKHCSKNKSERVFSQAFHILTKSYFPIVGLYKSSLRILIQ